MNKFCQIWFGCKTKEEAEKIADILLSQKLVACADGFGIDSRYFWNNKKVSEKRYQILAYSIFENKERIIEEIKKIHSDELPSIVFVPIEANNEYLEWVIRELNS